MTAVQAKPTDNFKVTKFGASNNEGSKVPTNHPSTQLFIFLIFIKPFLLPDFFNFHNNYFLIFQSYLISLIRNLISGMKCDKI